jgi:hypothetical protein
LSRVFTKIIGNQGHDQEMGSEYLLQRMKKRIKSRIEARGKEGLFRAKMEYSQDKPTFFLL